MDREDAKHDIRFGPGTHMHTRMYARWKIAALNASGTLGTSLELHPFSGDLRLSSDISDIYGVATKLYTACAELSR